MQRDRKMKWQCTDADGTALEHTETHAHSAHDERYRAQLISRILLAESEIETKSYSSFADFAKEIREEFNLTPSQ